MRVRRSSPSWPRGRVARVVQVHEQGVEVLRTRAPSGSPAGEAHGLRLVAFALQQQAQRLEDVRLVVGDQDTGSGSGHHALWSLRSPTSRPSRPRAGRSLAPQGDHGIDARRAAGGDQQAASATHREDHRNADEGRPDRRARRRRRACPPAAASRRRRRGVRSRAPASVRRIAASDDHAHHVARTRAERHADADLVRALRDGVGHHAVDPERRRAPARVRRRRPA